MSQDQEFSSGMIPPSSIEMEHISAIEKARASFTPEMQNILSTLTGALEPISTDFIVHLSSNEDGKAFGNKVAVTEENVKLLLDIIKQAEKQHGVHLLEVAPIKIDEQDEIPATPIGKTDLIHQPTTLGYRFVNTLQEFIKETYPQLYKDSHHAIADRLLADLGFDDFIDVPSRSSESLIPETESLGRLLDDSAKLLLSPSQNQ